MRKFPADKKTKADSSGKKAKRNESQLSYFKFFFNILHVKLIFSLLLNIFIGLLDGLGLTMLIPLLQSVDGSSKTKDSIGELKNFITFLESLGLSLTVNVVLVVFLLIFITKGIIKYSTSQYQTKLELFFVKKVQKQLLTSFQKLSYKGYLRLDAGQIQNTLIGEVWRVSVAMKDFLKWIQAFIMLATYVVLAYLANAEFAFLITVTVGLTNLFYRKLYKKIKSASYEISQKGQHLNKYLIEFIHHYKYLKSTSYLHHLTGRIKDVINERQRLNKQSAKYGAFISSMREPMVVTIVVVVMFIQITWLNGSISAIILSLLLFYRGLNHLMSIQSNWQSFLQYSGAFRTVNEMSEEMETHEEVFGTIPFDTVKSEISLQNVSLSLGSSKILKDINIRIPKNTTIALAGGSGAGKTSIVNVVLGLLQPDRGNVLLNGKNITDFDINSYRSKIGYISQEPVIFNDTLFNNITFWAEKTTENVEKFHSVIETASLVEFLSELEDKEDTILGDNGMLISGGQRQRISIAREIFKNPEILILDEATSALDSDTENIIQKNIEKLHGSRTMIIIAHRLSTIRKADIVYLLDKGRVTDSGSFDELLDCSEKFRSMVSLQKMF